MKKSISGVQISWGFSCLILLMAALDVVNVPDSQLVSVANRLGIAMAIAGGVNLAVYCTKHRKIHGCHWLLADGLTMVFLSIFPLFNTMIPINVIPFFFGIWELVSGVLKFTEFTELYEESIKGWQWFLGVGLIELLSGVASMVKPIDDFVGMNHVIAIIFVIQSLGFVFKIIMYHNLAASAPLFVHENNLEENNTQEEEESKCCTHK